MNCKAAGGLELVSVEMGRGQGLAPRRPRFFYDIQAACRLYSEALWEVHE